MKSFEIKSAAVFNHIFDLAKNDGQTLNPMKAIKLVYFAHAWHLGLYKKPLIDEQIEAWQYGTVIPSLYQSLKIYGGGVIRYPIMENQSDITLDILRNTFCEKNGVAIKGKLEEQEQKLIKTVWNAYKDSTAVQLSNRIHSPGTPWTQVWNNGNCGYHAKISNELIQKYYEKSIEDTRKRATEANNTNQQEN